MVKDIYLRWVDLSASEWSDAGYFLSYLLHYSSLFGVLISKSCKLCGSDDCIEVQGCPNDGGQHFLRVRLSDKDRLALAEMFYEDYVWDAERSCEREKHAFNFRQGAKEIIRKILQTVPEWLWNKNHPMTIWWRQGAV